MRTLRRDGRLPIAMMGALAALLAAGFALQLLVYGHGGHSALSDLPHLYLRRHVGPGSLPYVDRPIEYPVLAGVLLYLAALAWPSAFGVLAVTAVWAAVACGAVTVLLARRFGAHAWRWVLALPLLLYTFQNWDVFAIAALVVGLLA